MTPEEKEIIDSVLKKHNIVRYQQIIAKCMLDAMREATKEQTEKTARLKEALENLLIFAQDYGPSERASYTDWSGHFEEAENALKE